MLLQHIRRILALLRRHWQFTLAGTVAVALITVSVAMLVTRDTPRNNERPTSRQSSQQPTKKTPPKEEAPPPPQPQPQPQPQPLFAPQPTWQQDFTKMPDGPVDTNIWRYELDPVVPSYNGEKQGYTSSRNNVRIEGGKLRIEARKEAYQYPNDPEHRNFAYTSGRIDTLNSFSFEYGKIEAAIRMPAGAGTWPAFWLLSANQVHTAKLHPTEADWQQERFYMHDGELDIVEHYGHIPHIVEGTVYTYGRTIEVPGTVPTVTEQFHTYGVELTPTKITWTIDGKPYGTYEKPSDRPQDWPFSGGNRFFVLLNLAMGGSGGGNIDDSKGPWQMQVERVNFYEYTGPR